MGLEWVADNIEAFGGDPAAVTIWGESAGTVSVFNQMALYNGNNTYNGRPLFRASIMNSGSILSLEPVDGNKAQHVFDTVVESAGCSSSNPSTSLACLRSLDYATYLNATNSVLPFLSYESVALNYLPRPDGKALTASPHILAQSGKYAAVPVIIGDLEDEGTLFSLFQTNITTKAALTSYLNEIIFPSATKDQVTNLVNTYPYNNGSAGSPFGTGALNQTYPEFKRLAAILGDVTFILARRIFLETIRQSVAAWSYIVTWNHLATPILGTYHTTDLPRVFYGVDAASRAMQDRYISFVTRLDPNDGIENSSAVDYRTYWPSWHENRQLMEFGLHYTGLWADDFRDASFDFIKCHIDELRY